LILGVSLDPSGSDLCPTTDNRNNDRGYGSDDGRKHHWRDDAAHGMATTISEVEAYASLIQLLRLAQFCSDQWDDLTAP
jgi:hypothetical protein